MASTTGLRLGATALVICVGLAVGYVQRRRPRLGS